MNPIRFDPDGVPLFCSNDIEDYGMPELYGYETYRVIESREVAFTTDYKFEQQRDWRPVHRYDRNARFKTTLLNLLGERANIPDYVISMVKNYLKPNSKNLWNDTRAILKHFKQRKYYDFIPIIIKRILNIRLFEQLNSEKISSIMRDFNALVSKYDQLKDELKRKYFPNIRYIVFKLLELHSIHPSYPVPFVRTNRKNKLLNSIWKTLLNQNE